MKMILLAFVYLISPEITRIALPVALLVAYGLYHWWRWCMMHPKIKIENLPKPAENIVPVRQEPTVQAKGDEQSAAKPAEAKPEKAHHAEHEAKRTADTIAKSRNVKPEHKWASRWDARRARESEEQRLAFEASNPHSLESAYRKARANRPEMFVKLAEYSWFRGAMIETHFWLLLARAHGVVGLDEWLQSVRNQWMRTGRLLEEDNIYQQFPIERYMLARSLIMLKSGINTHPNMDFVTRIANDGDDDAKIILAYKRPNA